MVAEGAIRVGSFALLWARELSRRVIVLQSEDGSWNTDGTWWEDEPALVTSYALLALCYCRDALASG